MHVKTIFNRRYGHLFTFELNKTTFSLIVLLLIGILAGASPRAAAPPPPLPTRVSQFRFKKSFASKRNLAKQKQFRFVSLQFRKTTNKKFRFVSLRFAS